MVLKSNLFPDTMLIGEGDERKVLNIFKGNVEISDIAIGSAGRTHATFSITYYGVPSAECIRLFQAFRPPSYTYGIQINRVGISDGLTSSPVSAVNRCNSTSSNRMTFVFD
nr:type 4 pilus major pilin [Pectobacterium colocasium]